MKAISNQCEASYNIHLDQHLHPSECLTDRVLTSLKKTHNHSLSGHTLVTKRPVKRKHNSFKESYNRFSHSNLDIKNIEVKTLKSYQSSVLPSKLASTRHTRVSSMQFNVENFIQNIYSDKEKNREKIKKVKVMIEKLKNCEYSKRGDREDVRVRTKEKKQYKEIEYLEKCRTSMFSDNFVVRLIFKSWQDYAKNNKKH